MKEEILKELCKVQVTEYGGYSRGEYEGFYINDDDCPVVRYKDIQTKSPLKELKKAMIEMRNDGMVELVNAVDHEGRPHGSGWYITQKGLKYAVENKLVIKEV